MKREDLSRATEEIKAALDVATHAESTSNSEISFIDGDTFKDIARPLRRALRLIEKPTKPSRAEQEADLLFDVMNSGDGDVNYEIGCVLDEALDNAGVIYEHRHIFQAAYAVAESDSRIKAILRDLKRGVPASIIAQQLKERTFDARGQKGGKR